jgi:glycosyltransferase involved in cell wall biosynthesis
MNRRLLFVINTLGWGGAESQVIDLAVRFQSRGWTVAVATLVDQAERRGALEEAGVEVHTLGMTRGVPDIRAVFRLIRLIRNFRPTVVHSHIVHANLLSRVARLFCSIPLLISSAHNMNEGGRWREVAYRLTDRLTDLTTNVSRVAVERSIEVGSAPAHRIRFMANGIDLDRFRRDAEVRAAVRDSLGVGGRFVWLAVGRFYAQKDYPNLIRAFREVADHAANPILLIVGEGPERDMVEDAARAEQLEEGVRFLGRRDDVPDLMNAADGYVMSSAWEGLPIVLLEAAASGLPIVATEVGGNAQIVNDGETGELISAGDSAALSAAMTRMMERSEEERWSMGQKAVEFVRATFGIEEVVDRWEDLYLDLYSERFGQVTAQVDAVASMGGEHGSD